MKRETLSSSWGFLGKLLLASAAISLAIKWGGPQLGLPAGGVGDGMALAIVLSPPVLLGLLLLLRRQQRA